MVNEFPDVFTDELPGLPPDMEIEFTTDLAPGKPNQFQKYLTE